MAKPIPALELLPAPAPVPAQTVLGVPLALTDYARTLDWIDAAVAARQRGYICVAAVHTVMASQEDPELRAAVLASDLTVPDGQPLVWAMNLLGHNLPSRVYGPDLMEHACERAGRDRRALLPLRRARGVALARCATSCRARYPGLAGRRRRHAPFRELSATRRPSRDRRRAQRRRRRRRLGRPRRAAAGEVDGARCASGSTRPCSSASAPPSTSTPALKRQAPDGLQRLGLEWAFRLVQEPRRLWRRYLHYNPRFVIGFARQYVTTPARPALAFPVL